MEKKDKFIIKDGSAYCIKCERFLGMTCDPFGEGVCKKCFPPPHK